MVWHPRRTGQAEQESCSLFSKTCLCHLEHGVNIHMLCRNIGSSVTYVESTYSHVETAKSTEELTKGIGFIKKLEQQDK